MLTLPYRGNVGTRLVILNVEFMSLTQLIGAVHRTGSSDSLREVDAGESHRCAIVVQFWMQSPRSSMHSGPIWHRL